MTASSSMPPAGPPGATGPNQALMGERLRVNGEILTYYAASLSALMGLFMVAHWSRRLACNISRWTVFHPIVTISRIVRRVALRKLPGFTSVGHAYLVVVYVALNTLFSFYRLEYSKITNIAARFGWMATGNLALAVFLALKNTPLAVLTQYSYERLNTLHQISGYTTFLYAILHGSLYSYSFIHFGKIHILQEDIVTAGIVLGFSMFFTVLAGMTVRRLKYELFYIIHLGLFVVMVVTLGLHRPSFDKDKTLIVTVLVASLWCCDRLIRLARLMYNGINNKATIYPLPNGGTRIVLKKPMARARPGKHCYVWLPQIRAFETHPFTIVASEPMELIINSYSGFTRDLHKYASGNPGASLTVSVEGPYGTFPDPIEYDKVVLVAGGSGAAFTVGVAVSMIQRLPPDLEKQCDFIWTTRGYENLTWFTQHLGHLIKHACAPKVALKLYLTRLESTGNIPRPASQMSTEVASAPASVSEKSNETPVLSTQTSSVALGEKDVEKMRMTDATAELECIEAIPISYGRPNIEALVRDAIMSMDKDKRILVGACGPTGLVESVRNTVAECIRVEGPSVELHCEQFGW